MSDSEMQGAPEAGPVPPTLWEVSDGHDAARKELVAAHLARNKKGHVLSTAANLTAILNFDPAWKGVIAYDEFRECVVATKPPPSLKHEASARTESAWSDDDTFRAVSWIGHVYRVPFPAVLVDRAVVVHSRRNSKHEVRDYLRSLVWDGTKRVARFFEHYLGAEPSTFASRASEIFLLSAAIRMLRPGCKVDTVVVLEGGQGAYKSSAISALVSPA
jgi:putative DNA primase/helicase